jgi:hypothetical protein
VVAQRHYQRPTVVDHATVRRDRGVCVAGTLHCPAGPAGACRVHHLYAEIVCAIGRLHPRMGIRVSIERTGIHVNSIRPPAARNGQLTAVLSIRG